MWAARVADGYVFGGMSPEAQATFEGVPLLLESNDPRVVERLYPETCTTDEDEAQWRDHAVPELERLFASRGQLVRRDLAAMRRSGEPGAQVLVVPDGHVNAWLAALNAARLALFHLNDLTQAWMEGRDVDAATDKQREALARIHLLAEVQAVLLGDYELQSVDDAEEEDATEGDEPADDADAGESGSGASPRGC